MEKLALTNVRVFDGERLLEPSTVVIDGMRIGADPAGARTWDGHGGVLLPGLIDCHIHLTDDATLTALARHGVTTALDMGTWPPELVASLRDRPGVTDVRSSGTGAVQRASTSGQVVVPTLTMMEAIVERLGGIAPVSYDVARSTVGQWYRAGVTVLAGTDANQAPSAPGSPPYGSSLHHELELLVDAGLSTVDAVRSATILAAQHFGLADRGAIAAGKRADLVLIDGDPLQDISAVSKIAAVWCAGVPAAGAPARTEEAR